MVGILEKKENYEENIVAVEPDLVKKVAEKYLNNKQRVRGVLMPLGGLND